MSFEYLGDSLEFTLSSEPSDETPSRRGFSKSQKFSYRNTNGKKFPETHPDRLALVAIMNALPFTGRKLKINWPISEKFLESSNQSVSRIEISAASTSQKPISRIANGRPALLFSGGADSVAALSVMPPSTEPVFMLRTKRPWIRSLYDSDAAQESCKKLRKLGFEIHIIESDFEYLRDPIGFPTDLSVATPAILISESRNFDSIAFGTILESAYGTSGEKFRQYRDSSHFRLWHSLFESVGLGYSLPVAGVSEVGTAILCRQMALGNFHQSCIRGKWGKPCNNCWKCFRKNTLMQALDGGEFPKDAMMMLGKSKEVRKRLLEDRPIKHEGVLSYSLERSLGGGPEVDLLRDLVRVGKIETDWMNSWYSESSEFIDHSYRGFTSKKLRETLGEMSAEEISHLQNWENKNDEIRENILSRLTKLV